MALAKAKAGFEQAGGTAHTVLGSDTAVVLGDRIFGKPTDRDDALEMLLMLSGNTHRVMSAVALVADGRVAQRLSITEVEFRAIASTEAAAYWRTGEPTDKAGGYGIQGLGALFVKALHGSYSGVVGLPLFETAELLGEFGFELIVNDG
jgi:septum formation protein